VDDGEAVLTINDRLANAGVGLDCPICIQGVQHTTYKVGLKRPTWTPQSVDHAPSLVVGY